MENTANPRVNLKAVSLSLTIQYHCSHSITKVLDYSGLKIKKIFSCNLGLVWPDIL